MLSVKELLQPRYITADRVTSFKQVIFYGIMPAHHQSSHLSSTPVRRHFLLGVGVVNSAMLECSASMPCGVMHVYVIECDSLMQCLQLSQLA